MINAFSELQTEYNQWKQSTPAYCVAGIYRITTNLMFELGLADDDPLRAKANQSIRGIELNSMSKTLGTNLMHNSYGFVTEMTEREFGDMGHEACCMVMNDSEDKSEEFLLNTFSSWLMSNTTTEWSMEHNLNEHAVIVSELWKRLSEFSQDDAFVQMADALKAARKMTKVLLKEGRTEFTDDESRDFFNHRARVYRLLPHVAPELGGVGSFNDTVGQTAFQLTVATEFKGAALLTDLDNLYAARFVKLYEAGINGEEMA